MAEYCKECAEELGLLGYDKPPLLCEGCGKEIVKKKFYKGKILMKKIIRYLIAGIVCFIFVAVCRTLLILIGVNVQKFSIFLQVLLIGMPMLGIWSWIVGGNKEEEEDRNQE